MVERLATQLLIPPEAIVVTAVEPRDWPDACLGVAAEDEICASVLTPGYQIVLSVGIDIYEFRTDLTAERIRIASGPPARTGDPLVTWRDRRSFNMMIIGTQRVALGRRGRPLIASPLAVPARAAELQDFLAHYAPFEAKTPAGDVALRGVGSVRPDEVEQRLLAEWARLVSIEARLGAEDPEANVALRWTFEGAPGGVCDRIEVTRTGMASAASCRDGQPTPIAGVTLTTAELGVVYRWLDRFEGFEAPVAAPNGGSIRLVFRGTGLDEAGPADQQAMLDWIDALARRLREAALQGRAG